MTDEASQGTKTDVLDLIISFIMEHEKRMDEIVDRLERLSKRMSRSSNLANPRRPRESRYDSDIFTLTISNPEDYDKIRSVKIDWETGEKEYTPEISEIDAILDKIDFTFKDK